MPVKQPAPGELEPIERTLVGKARRVIDKRWK
jgi:hypothetical protein